jgi:outer membrane lipoprotein-sorting protein
VPKLKFFPLFLAVSAIFAQTQAHSINDVLQAYTRALGGAAAIDKIQTREIQAKLHHRVKVTYYWAKPDKVLRVSHGEKAGFDGSSAWILSPKKKLTKLPKPDRERLEMNANPLRYARLKDLYSEVNSAPDEQVNGQPMQVLVAPNNIASTKFYFDAGTHLLVRIEELGETSAYYKQVTEYSEYKQIDGVQFPFRIEHSSEEPGGNHQDLRISKVEQNIDLQPEVFAKPRLGNVTLGGKR